MNTKEKWGNEIYLMEELVRILLIDDMRTVPNAVIARDFKTGLQMLEDQSWDVLLIDHDLGEEKTGYDIMCWLEEHPEKVPKRIICVSSNPVGRKRIEQIIRKIA